MELFADRLEAGKALARRLLVLKPGLKRAIVLGVARGGIPVGYQVAKALGIPLEPIVLRKLPIPTDPEAGFGAVTVDRTAIFNDQLLPGLGLDPRQIDRIVEDVYREVLRRDKLYRGKKPFPQLRGRSVIITDDGLASGFTVLAAVKYIRKKRAREIIVAAPVAHRQAYELISANADKVVALQVSDQAYFAVASFYREFPDMTDEEVMGYLTKEET